MWKKIKAFLNLKLVFSFLEERHKLNLILINKTLKNKFGYTLEYYKEISGKIKIAEKNGKGKEFKNDQLIFEGNYLNYKKSGEGKEYNNNKIIFEGNYSLGKRNGTGIEYDYIKDKKYPMFKGEYLNGKRNGEGKEYFNNNIIKFDGEFKMGKKLNGNGFDYSGNNVYEINNGKGDVIEYNNGGQKIFEGEYLNGERSGNGKEFLTFNKNEYMIFEGKYLKGKRNGLGKEYRDIIKIFEGNIRMAKEMEKEKILMIVI